MQKMQFGSYNYLQMLSKNESDPNSHTSIISCPAKMYVSSTRHKNLLISADMVLDKKDARYVSYT